MRAKLIALVLVLLIAAGAMGYDRVHEFTPAPLPSSSQGTKGQPAPDIVFTTLDGKTFHLRALPERGIILHFWASWCAPCQMEFPALLRAVADSHGALALVAVSIDDNPAAMRAFTGRMPAAPHVYWVWDEGKTISLPYFDTVRVPESVLIDGRRTMVDKMAGDPGWASAAMARKIDLLTR